MSSGGSGSRTKQSLKAPATLTTLQMGRAFAALAVAAFHLSLMMGLPRYGGDPVLQNWTSRGSLGVDFFFVLSGFIILMAHYGDIGKPARVRRYIWRRFVRVYPIYWIYSAVFVALVLAGLGNATPMPTTPAGWVSAVTLIRFSAENPPIVAAWTLFHEVAFYAIFAILVLNRRAGLVAIALWVAVCVAVGHYPGESGRTPFAVYTSAYSVHFMLGMLTFLAYRHFRWRACVAIGAVALVILIIAEYGSGQASKFVFACGVSGLLLICASLEREFGIHAPGWLRYIGDSSYSLYLLHTALVGLLLKLALKAKLAQSIGGVGTFFVVLVGVTLIACLAYRLVERPLLQALRSGIRFRRRTGGQASLP
jgi:peptidoglycan/LPS O-acetylase OafA/YrhL